MDVADVGRAVLYMANLPLDANVSSDDRHGHQDAVRRPRVGRPPAQRPARSWESCALRRCSVVNSRPMRAHDATTRVPRTVSSVAAPRLIAAAHGTKSAAGLATLAELADLIRRARPASRSTLCYLDVLEPSLRSRAGRRSGPSVVVPMLLSTGYHVAHDIPSVTAGRPEVRVADRLGPDPLLSSALVDRLAEAGWDGGRLIALVALRIEPPSGGRRSRPRRR